MIAHAGAWLLLVSLGLALLAESANMLLKILRKLE